MRYFIRTARRAEEDVGGPAGRYMEVRHKYAPTNLPVRARLRVNLPSDDVGKYGFVIQMSATVDPDSSSLTSLDTGFGAKASEQTIYEPGGLFPTPERTDPYYVNQGYVVWFGDTTGPGSSETRKSVTLDVTGAPDAPVSDLDSFDSKEIDFGSGFVYRPGIISTGGWGLYVKLIKGSMMEITAMADFATHTHASTAIQLSGFQWLDDPNNVPAAPLVEPES